MRSWLRVRLNFSNIGFECFHRAIGKLGARPGFIPDMMSV